MRWNAAFLLIQFLRNICIAIARAHFVFRGQISPMWMYVTTQWCRFLSQEVRETKPRKWIPHHGHRAPNNYGKKYHIIWEPRLVTISDFKSIVEPFIRRDAASDKLLLSMTGELLHKMLCGNSALPNVYCQSAALSVRLVVCYLILAADFTFLAQRTKFGPGGPPNFKLD